MPEGHFDKEILTHTPGITRPPKEILKRLQAMGTANAVGSLFRLGIRNAHIIGPTCWTPERCIAGPALTLQFLPKREDLYDESEYADPERQLHRHVLYHTEPGDIVVVDARGDMSAGIFGEMMLTYFRGRGGAGIVIDGCVRDYGNIKKIDMGVWIRGVTPNFHTQTNLMPHAVNVPIACGGVTVMPGDIIIADIDGAICVPAGMAEKLLEHAKTHHEWEDFTKIRLSEGGDLRRYYPLSDAARPEYEEWKRRQGRTD